MCKISEIKYIDNSTIINLLDTCLFYYTYIVVNPCISRELENIIFLIKNNDNERYLFRG